MDIGCVFVGIFGCKCLFQTISLVFKFILLGFFPKNYSAMVFIIYKI